MVSGYKDGNKKFHPISNTKVKTRKKRLDYKDPELLAHTGVKINPKTNQRMKRISLSELSDPSVAVKMNKTMHNEGLRLSREREITETDLGTRIFKDTGELVSKTDSLHDRGHFEKLKSGQWVFVPVDLSKKQQEASVDIVNGDIKDTDMFDISEVFLISSSTIPDKFSNLGVGERITTGKEVKRIIARNVKKYGWIPAYNVSKAIKPI